MDIDGIKKSLEKFNQADIEGIKESISFDNESNTEELNKNRKRISGMEQEIGELNEKLKHFEDLKISKNTEELNKNRKRISDMEKEIGELNEKLKHYEDSKIPQNNATNIHIGHREEEKETAEILMCFDSNGKHIDRRKLWKVNKSIYKRCSNIFKASQLIITEDIKELKYILLSIGVNDLDNKHHTQVFGEMRTLIDQIRLKYPGIKIIIGEATPRKDERDDEVKQYNNLLKDFASDNADITVAIHENLRDPTWSLYYDSKHIHEQKIAKYASNLIRALKQSYKINNKSELFTTNNHRNDSRIHSNSHTNSHFFPYDDRTKNHWNISNSQEVVNNSSRVLSNDNGFINSHCLDSTNDHLQISNRKEVHNERIKGNMENLANYQTMPSYPSENSAMKKLRYDLMLNLTNAIQQSLGYD